jgi:CHAD domain-containing protein
MSAALSGKWIERRIVADGLSVVAVRSLRSRLGDVLQLLPLGAEQAEDNVKFVHKLRVSTRRASVALTLYRDVLPRRRLLWLKKQLKRIRRAANDPRDCDVIIELLGKERPSPWEKRWLDEIRVERNTAQHAVVRLKKRLRHGRRFARQIDQLLQRVRYRGDDRAHLRPACFCDWARTRLHPLVEKFFKAIPIDKSDEVALHDLRIRCKKLRYALELVGSAFQDRFRIQPYAALKSVQRRLGDINNFATATARLRRKFAGANAPVEVDGWGRLLATELRLLREACQSFWDWFTPEKVQSLREGFEAALGQSNRSEMLTYGRVAPSRTAVGDSMPTATSTVAGRSEWTRPSR